MALNCVGNLTRNAAIAGIGKSADRIGQLDGDARGDRHFPVRIYIAHTRSVRLNRKRRTDLYKSAAVECVILSNRFPLHDVDDVEAFTKGIVNRAGLDLTLPNAKTSPSSSSRNAGSSAPATGPEESRSASSPAGRSGSEPSTGSGNIGDARNGSSPLAATNGPAYSSSVSTASIPIRIEWERLSPEAAWTTVHIAWPMSCGYSTSEVAGQVGETTGWVKKRVEALRLELEQ
jgi:hypothetical protein